MNTDNITTVKFGKKFYHMHADMIRWCYEAVGPGGWGHTYTNDYSSWMITCNLGDTIFYFRNSEDALAFKLIFPCYATS